MAVTVQLQVDTSAAKAALNQINGAITQIKINGSQIEIGEPGKVVSQIKEIDAASEKLARDTERASEGTVKNVIKQLSKVSGVTRGAMNEIRLFADGLVSKWTAIVVAVEMSVVSFKYFFENLTQSIPKLNQKMDTLNNIVKKNYDQWKEQKQVSDDYRKSLEQLSTKQNLSNIQQVYAQAIIDKLNQKYKGLNITIDDTTKSVKGYTEAIKQMDRQDAEAEKKLIKRQLQAKKEQVDAKLAQTFGNSKVTLNGSVSAEDMFTNAQNWFSDIAQQAQVAINKAWNSGDNNAKLKVLQDLATRYSNNQTILKSINGAISAMQELIKLQNQYNELSEAGYIIRQNAKKVIEDTKDAIKQTAQITAQTDKIYEAIAADQEKTWFDNLGTEQQKINFLESKIKTLQEQERGVNSKIGDLESKDSNVEAISNVSKGLKSQIEADKKAIVDLKKSIQDVKREYHQNEGKDLLMADPKKLQERIKKVRKTVKELEAYNSGQTLYSQKKQQLSELVAQYNAVMKIRGINKQIQKKTLQINSLTQKLTANEQKYADAVKAGVIDEQELAKLKNEQAKINKEIYEKTKQQDKLRDAIAGKELKTLEDEQKARQKIAEAEAELAQKRKDINQNFFQTNKQNQVTQYLKLIGKQREALILQQKINLARALGLKSIKELNAAQVKGIEKQVDMQMKLDEFAKMNSVDVNRPEIISNQLARKGGFASSVVVERNNINKNILNAAQQQVNLQNAIKNEISKYGVIQ